MLNPMSTEPKNLSAALSIAGSDSGGGAGIQADLLTFAACGVFGTTAITCLTAQNPESVSHVQAADPENLRAQMTQVLDYFPIQAIKTGMLFNRELIEVVVDALKCRIAPIPLVVDPVMIATSGSRLLKPEAEAALVHHLIPLARLVTPNTDEASVLSGIEIHSESDVNRAAVILTERFKTAFLLKGGHLDGPTVVNLLCQPDKDPIRFESLRISNVNTHGSGCTLAAAITAYIAKGYTLEQSVANALDYVHRALTHPLKIRDTAFMAHLR
jgi:hydroxymethylpyrimidine/phosphomethylpyrimidine kinase